MFGRKSRRRSRSPREMQTLKERLLAAVAAIATFGLIWLASSFVG